jgi:hypothetical protein
MPTKEQILRHLTLAEKHIAEAKEMIEGESPAEDYVLVNPGDNLIQMIQDNPEDTTFQIHSDFVQDCGIDAQLAKPCTLISERARLIGIFFPKPNTHFIGMTLDGANENTILTGADNVTLESCILNGNPEKGQHRGISANCRGMRVKNTKILNIAKDQDTQAIWGANGTNDLEVTGCILEASGENVLFGGDTSTSEENIPRNIKIEGNYITKKIAWKDSSATCKNLIELKQADGIIIVGNTMEYSFVDGQTGYAIVLTVRNEYGASPWANVKNVIVENNIIRHVAGGIHILGRDDRNTSQIMTNILIKNNKIEDMSWDWGGNGRQIFITGGPDKVTFEGNEFDCPTLPNSAISFDQPEHLCTDLVFRDQIQLVEGEYGIIGTSAPSLGVAALEMYAPGYIWENNNVKKSDVNPYITWPEGTNFV